MDRITFIFKSMDDIYDMVKHHDFISMVQDGEIDYLVDHHFNELTIVIKAKDEDNKRVLQACYDLAFFYAYYN